MPWHIEDHPDGCAGFGVVKDDTGEVVGCHETEADAQDQLAALYAEEPEMDAVRTAPDEFAEYRKAVEGRASRITVPIEVRAEPEASDDANITIQGHASVFDRLSEDLGGFRERIHRGAFRKPLDEAHDVRLLVNHEPYPVLARTKAKTLELREDPRGLRLYADVAATSFAKDLRVSMQRGDIDQMSYGFIVAPGGDKWTKENDQVVRDVYAFERLIDVSIVTFPAYPQTDVSARNVEPANEVPTEAASGEESASNVDELAEADAQNADVDDLLPTGDERTVLVRRSLAERIVGALERGPGESHHAKTNSREV